MIVINEADVRAEEPSPHGHIGTSTAFRITNNVPRRAMEFRKRILHRDAAIGLHVLDHDEVYYVMSGNGIVASDGREEAMSEGMTAYLYTGADVGIRQVGTDPLVLIIAFPLAHRTA